MSRVSPCTTSSARSVFPGEENTANVEPSEYFLELVPFGLEKIYDYEPGGHHPVHLGDVLGSRSRDRPRYCVLHKLGNGGFANVWFCRDMESTAFPKYVALKILAADASTDDCPELRAGKLKDQLDDKAGEGGRSCFCLPLDQFEICGLNGRHLCFVYPVLGPTVSRGLFRGSPNHDEILRNIGHKIATAIDTLHGRGICHGDITPSNILHRISGLDGLAEDNILQILGKPIQNRVLGGLEHSPERSAAPQYLVYPVRWDKVDLHYINPQPCLIDFGESFKVSHPPEDLGIPGPYRSPELILDKAAGLGSDLWALGCTLFEIRTGRKLFNPFDDDDDSCLDAMVQVLGKMPEPWWSTTWQERRGMYKDEADEYGRAVAAGTVATAGGEEPEETGISRLVHPSIAQGARSLRDMLAPGLWYLSSEKDEADYHRGISEAEKELLVDLLRKILEYNPSGRIRGKDLLSHKWFSFRGQ